VRAHTDSEHARQAAERASAAKSQFLAVMSHELRTPMNAILGFTDLLDAEISGPMNDVQKSHLSRVRASAVHLLGLIDQVLSLARIEAGREEVFVEEVDVGAVVADVAAMMQPLAERRGLTLTIDVEPPLLHTTSDAGKLRQILLNLIGNAIKFTDEGTVSLHVTASGEQLQVAIADTGRGIARDDMERIFDPFEQVDQTISRRAEGTGLGLPVSRELARLLGGEIVAVSEPGRGSTFTLRLPVAGPPPTAQTVEPAAS
jgi:signal transduction histidine kinase